MKFTGTADEHIKVNGKFYGYAWFVTEAGEEIAVAYKVGRYNTKVLVTDPTWNWIKKERTEAQQAWIEENIADMQKALV